MAQQHSSYEDNDEVDMDRVDKALREAAKAGDPWAQQALALEAAMNREAKADHAMDLLYPQLRAQLQDAGFWKYILYMLSIAQLAFAMDEDDDPGFSPQKLATLFRRLELGVFGSASQTFADLPPSSAPPSKGF